MSAVAGHAESATEASEPEKEASSDVDSGKVEEGAAAAAQQPGMPLGAVSEGDRGPPHPSEGPPPGVCY